MGKDDERILRMDAASANEPVDPNDPVHWDEPTLRTEVAVWLDTREGNYRGRPDAHKFILDEGQQKKFFDTVVKYWMPKDIDAVVLLAKEDDDAQKIPRTSDRTRAVTIRKAYDNKINDGLSERAALGQVKVTLMESLIDNDFKAIEMPSNATANMTLLMHDLANWTPPSSRPTTKGPRTIDGKPVVTAKNINI